MADVEFQTMKSDEIKFGKNNFLEIARKKAVAQEGENEFIAISRGYFLPDGTKRFRRSLALPDQSDIIDFVVKKLAEFHQKDGKKAAPAAKKEAEPAPAEEKKEEAKE